MPYLIVERAGVIVERRKLDRDEVTIGRASDSDVVLDDPQIGSQLAKITRDGVTWVLEDLGSMTGVTHGNERVSQLALTDGIRFEAFPFTFIFEDDDSGGEGDSSTDSPLEATMAMDMDLGGQAELVAINRPIGPFQLEAGVNVVGRGETVGIRIDDKMVSKEHALIICLPGEYIIEDKGSSNGTFVNRKRVDRAPLRDGDLVQFGGVEMKLVIEGGGGGAESAAASETADVSVDGLLMGGALEQQAQAMSGSSKGKSGGWSAPSSSPAPVTGDSEKPKGKGKKVMLLGLVGCLGVVLVGLLLVVVLSTGGSEPTKPQTTEAQLKLEQAQAILQSDQNFQEGIDLVDSILASEPSDAVREEALALKDELQKAIRRPVPLHRMNPPQLRDKANELIAAGDILKSVRYWERLVTIDPTWEECGKTYATLMLQIGMIYEGAGRSDQAVEVWRRTMHVMGEPGEDNPSHRAIQDRLRDAGVRS